MTASLLANDIDVSPSGTLTGLAIGVFLIVFVWVCWAGIYSRSRFAKVIATFAAAGTLAAIFPAIAADRDHTTSRDVSNVKAVRAAFPELRAADAMHCVVRVVRFKGETCKTKVIDGNDVVELEFANVNGEVVYFEKNSRRIGGKS